MFASMLERLAHAAHLRGVVLRGRAGQEETDEAEDDSPGGDAEAAHATTHVWAAPDSGVRSSCRLSLGA